MRRFVMAIRGPRGGNVAVGSWRTLTPEMLGPVWQVQLPSSVHELTAATDRCFYEAIMQCCKSQTLSRSREAACLLQMQQKATPRVTLSVGWQERLGALRASSGTATTYWMEVSCRESQYGAFCRSASTGAGCCSRAKTVARRRTPNSRSSSSDATTCVQLWAGGRSIPCYHAVQRLAIAALAELQDCDPYAGERAHEMAELEQMSR